MNKEVYAVYLGDIDKVGSTGSIMTFKEVVKEERIIFTDVETNSLTFSGEEVYNDSRWYVTPQK